MATHDHTDIDPGQGTVVEIYSHEGLGDKAGRRRKTWRVIIDRQIVVDGLGNVDAAKRIVGGARLLGDYADRIGTVVSADVEETVDPVCPRNAQYLAAIFLIRFVAGRAQCRGWRFGDAFEAGSCFLGQIDKVLVDNAANTVDCAINLLDVAIFAGFDDGARHRLIDDRSGATALGQ